MAIVKPSSYLRIGHIASIASFATFWMQPFECRMTSSSFAASNNGIIQALQVVSEEEDFTAAGLHCWYCTISAMMLEQHYERSVGLRLFLKELTFFWKKIISSTYLWYDKRKKLLVIQNWFFVQIYFIHVMTR